MIQVLCELVPSTAVRGSLPRQGWWKAKKRRKEESGPGEGKQLCHSISRAHLLCTWASCLPAGAQTTGCCCRGALLSHGRVLLGTLLQHKEGFWLTSSTTDSAQKGFSWTHSRCILLLCLHVPSICSTALGCVHAREALFGAVCEREQRPCVDAFQALVLLLTAAVGTNAAADSRCL